MDHSTRRCLGLKKRDRVVVGISCVDDHRQIELLRYRQLPAEYFALNIAWRIVVVVIEAGFADRQHARMPDELFHQAVMPFFDFRSIVWMDTGACIDPVVFFGDWNSTSHLVGTTAVSDRQYLSDSRIPGALEYGIAIVVKARVVDVSVGINQHVKSSPFPSLKRRGMRHQKDAAKPRLKGADGVVSSAKCLGLKISPDFS